MALPTTGRTYDFIRGFIASNGESPTFSEIATRFNVSIATVTNLLRALEREGLIVRAPGSQRGIKLVEQNNADAATAK